MHGQRAQTSHGGRSETESKKYVFEGEAIEKEERWRIDRLRVEARGSIYQVDPFLHIVTLVRDRVQQIAAGQKGKPGFVDGAAGVSMLNKPSTISLTVDSKGLIICDEGNAAVRRLHLETGELITLRGNSPERIVKTWMPAGEGLAGSLRCPGGSVSIVKTSKEAVWSTAFAPLPKPPQGGEPHRLSWCIVVHNISRFSVRVGIAHLQCSLQVTAHCLFKRMYFIRP
jgi:hypothetical protein